MLRKLMLGAVLNLSLVVSSVDGAPREPAEGPASTGSVSTSANAESSLYVVRYFEFGRWQGIGPLSVYDAYTVLADLQRRGYRAYIEPANR